jgi:hypothetical protein
MLLACHEPEHDVWAPGLSATINPYFGSDKVGIQPTGAI